MTRSARKILFVALTTLIANLLLVNDILAAPDQATIDLAHPQALDDSGIYELKQMDPALTGSGVKFAVISRSITYIDGEPQNDYRPDVEHNCFEDVDFRFSDQGDIPAGVSAHSTAICSILFGQDSEAFYPNLGQLSFQGAVPQAQADVFEFWHFLTDNVFANKAPDADIITACIGSQFEDWWTRGIEAMAEHQGIIVVAGIGNGKEVHDPVLYPAAAANVIGVGVVDCVKSDDAITNLQHFALTYPEHSSFGPAADGRCKPDIVAPGNRLAADTNDPNRYEPTGSWSSFSTPVVAGAVGLLVQKAKQEPALAEAAGNSVIKAILLNSATKLPFWHKGRLEKADDHSVPLDYAQGAGMLNAVQAYKNLTAGQHTPGDTPNVGWDNNVLNLGENPQNTYKITITDSAEKYITTTVTWNRHYNNSYPFEAVPEKDGNLRLELWAIDQNDNEHLVDYSDSSVDNVEHIYYLVDSNYTDYEIVVSVSDPEAGRLDSNHRYGLAWSADVAHDKESILRYDLNADGIVNELDFIILAENMAAVTKSPDSYMFGDINSDNTIDINDVQILFDHVNLKADWYND